MSVTKAERTSDSEESSGSNYSSDGEILRVFSRLSDSSEEDPGAEINNGAQFSQFPTEQIDKEEILKQVADSSSKKESQIFPRALRSYLKQKHPHIAQGLVSELPRRQGSAIIVCKSLNELSSGGTPVKPAPAGVLFDVIVFSTSEPCLLLTISTGNEKTNRITRYNTELSRNVNQTVRKYWKYGFDLVNGVVADALFSGDDLVSQVELLEKEAMSTSLTYYLMMSNEKCVEVVKSLFLLPPQGSPKVHDNGSVSKEKSDAISMKTMRLEMNNAELEASLKLKDREIHHLKQKFDAISMKVQRLEINNAELEASLTLKDSEIHHLKEKFHAILMKTMRLEMNNAELEASLEVKDREIHHLKQKVKDPQDEKQHFYTAGSPRSSFIKSARGLSLEDSDFAGSPGSSIIKSARGLSLEDSDFGGSYGTAGTLSSEDSDFESSSSDCEPRRLDVICKEEFSSPQFVLQNFQEDLRMVLEGNTVIYPRTADTSTDPRWNSLIQTIKNYFKGKGAFVYLASSVLMLLNQHYNYKRAYFHHLIGDVVIFSRGSPVHLLTVVDTDEVEAFKEYNEFLTQTFHSQIRHYVVGLKGINGVINFKDCRGTQEFDKVLHNIGKEHGLATIVKWNLGLAIHAFLKTIAKISSPMNKKVNLFLVNKAFTYFIDYMEGSNTILVNSLAFEVTMVLLKEMVNRLSLAGKVSLKVKRHECILDLHAMGVRPSGSVLILYDETNDSMEQGDICLTSEWKKNVKWIFRTGSRPMLSSASSGKPQPHPKPGTQSPVLTTPTKQVT